MVLVSVSEADCGELHEPPSPQDQIHAPVRTGDGHRFLRQQGPQFFMQLNKLGKPALLKRHCAFQIMKRRFHNPNASRHRQSETIVHELELLSSDRLGAYLFLLRKNTREDEPELTSILNGPCSGSFA